MPFPKLSLRSLRIPRARTLLLSLATTFLTACDGAAPTLHQTRQAAAHILITAGDRQTGHPNQPLERAIGVTVSDDAGVPIVGAVVRWSAVGGAGSVDPAETLTGSNGTATATWTLGDAVGMQHARASLAGLDDADFIATATDPSPDAITLLDIATPDGSNQTAHPDYVSMPEAWSAAKDYLVVTPYPNSDANLENPSLYQQDQRRAKTTDIDWIAPNAVQNPLVVPPTNTYLSDPDAVYDAEHNELWVYYRQVGQKNVIRVMRSADGVHFGAPQTVAEGANHVIVSPSIVRRDRGEWLMWSVNANSGCDASQTTVEVRRSTNGLDWSAPHAVDLAQPGFAIWHIDVQWIPSRAEFWAMYNVKNGGSCATPALYLATSADGMHWTTYPSPVLARGEFSAFSDIVYRSTFAYDDATDALRIWYSGATFVNGEYVWKSAFQRRTRADLFAAIARPPAIPLAAAIRSAVPPLHQAP